MAEISNEAAETALDELGDIGGTIFDGDSVLEAKMGQLVVSGNDP